MENNTSTGNTLFYSGPSSKSSRIIYTPSPFAHSLLYLQETGTLKAIHPHVSGRKGLASYLMFVVKSGSGWLEYPGGSGHPAAPGNKVERYELCEGDCCFIDCRCGYAQSSSDDLWQISWVHFNGSQMPAIWNKYCERGGKPVFRPADVTPFITLLDNLYTTASSDDFLKDMHISELLVRLTTLLMEQTVYEEGMQPVSISTGSNAAIDITQIKSYIDTHYNTPLSLELLSDHFHFNKNYVSRRFKEDVGMSVGSYIQIVRVGRAKQLLRFTSRTVEEISYETGYGGDSNYFSRVFKKVEGVPPSSYRRSWMSGNKVAEEEK